MLVNFLDLGGGDMIRPGYHGYDEDQWNLAKKQAKEILAERARLRGMIPYSELVAKIAAIDFNPHDIVFFHFLGEISKEEAEAGRGMMTALVVHKDGDMQPGPGFYELAKSLGRDVCDIDVCWVNEFKKVYAAWAPN
jgi:hypothetical protein